MVRWAALSSGHGSGGDRIRPQEGETAPILCFPSTTPTLGSGTSSPGSDGEAGVSRRGERTSRATSSWRHYGSTTVAGSQTGPPRPPPRRWGSWRSPSEWRRSWLGDRTGGHLAPALPEPHPIHLHARRAFSYQKRSAGTSARSGGRRPGGRAFPSERDIAPQGDFLGPLRGIDPRRAQPNLRLLRLPGGRSGERVSDRLAPRRERRLDHPLERIEIRRGDERRGAGNEPQKRGIDRGPGRKRGGAQIQEADAFGSGAAEEGQDSVGAGTGRREDSIRHLPLDHQGEIREAIAEAQEPEDRRGSDGVGEVPDDAHPAIEGKVPVEEGRKIRFQD